MINTFMEFIKNVGTRLQDSSLLILRLLLAYGFYNPAKRKLTNLDGIASWFESMNFPLPTFNAYLVAITEGLGVVLLLLGLGTRLISLPLIVVMIVAIAIHWGNGFSSSEGGFEIALYYLVMLFALFAFGGGKYSLDYLLGRKR